MRPTSTRSTVRPVGRTAVVLTLGGWLLSVAAGCGRTPDGDFHAYPTDPAAKSTDSDATAGQPTVTTSVAEQNAAADGAPARPAGDERPVQTAAAANDGAQPKSTTDAATSPTDAATTPNSGATEPGAGKTSSTKIASSDATPVVTSQKPQRVAPGDAMLRRVPEPNDDAAIAELPPRPIQLLIAEKEFRKEKGLLRVSYDDIDLLKILNMEPVPFDAVSHFPSWLKSLDGQRVRLRGFMYPPYEETGLTHFVLARDNQICCFGRNPKVYDLVDVRMKPGVTTDYIQNRPFDVIGTFHIQPDGDGTRLFELYRIDDATVFER